MVNTKTAEKAKIVLLSGFLGSGKTTLLQRILSWSTNLSDTVVIVNEFGDAGIDGSLLQENGSDIVELSSGCICCTLSADFLQSLRNIWNRFHPRYILIEATGVADPATIVTVINESEEISCNMELFKIITVLDADYWQSRELFGPLFYSQVEIADLILLNKIDEHEKEEIPKFLAEIHELLPHTQVIPTIRCQIDPETIWSQGETDVKHLNGFFPSTHVHHHHEHVPKNYINNYVSFSFCHKHKLKKDCFHQFLSELPWEVFRVKGPVCFLDGTMMLNFVGGKSELIPWKEVPETRLVFIGWNVVPDEILKRLEPCIINA